MESLSKTLDSLSQFNVKWGQNWPFIADHQSISPQYYQFVRFELPRIIAENAQTRNRIQDFFDAPLPEISQDPCQLAAYLSLFAYTALAFRRPYIEKDPEKLAATPVVSEDSIRFPEALSQIWTKVANNLGIEASTSLTALVYCNFSCEIVDLPLYLEPLDEIRHIDALISHQRIRFKQASMHFCNHYEAQNRQLYCDFIKIFLYSEIVGRRIYWWAEVALRASVNKQPPERIVDSLSVLVRWAIEALNQHIEAQEDIPKAALSVAQFTPAIKLLERKSTPGVTGILIPFLDEFFGFTSESSSYLEKVRLSRSFVFQEMAAALDSCQENCPYQAIYAQMPPIQQQQLEVLRSTLWEVMKEWRIFHRNQVGRFLSKGVESQESTPQIKSFLRSFIKNMNERMRSFDYEK
jgi:hypothetical protein